MGYTNFNIRLDDELRSRAYPVLAQYGLTPSQAVRMFFNQIGQTGEVPLSFNWGNKLSANGESLLRESLADIEQGRFSSHTAQEVVDLAGLADE